MHVYLSGFYTLATSDFNLFAAIVGSQLLSLPKELQSNLVSVRSGHPKNWGESNMAEASPRTDTSTDDTEDKNQQVTPLASMFEYMLFPGSS